MKLPDWNAAEWVLILTLALLGCAMIGLLAGLGFAPDKLP